MCLIVFAHRVHPSYRLVLAANRDELHARPTAPLAEWRDAPGVFGGRDLQAGGTWLAASREGRWAAVTNFRDFRQDRDRSGARVRSRGELVSNFVVGRETPSTYSRELQRASSEFGGFNLLIGDAEEVVWTSNRSDTGEFPELAPGVYGVSNHLLDTPWPKVVRGKQALTAALQKSALRTDGLLDLLLDRAVAADHDLPDTGVTRDLERALSAAFIHTPGYGTRCSSALLVGHDGHILFAERSFGPDGQVSGEIHLEI